MLRSFTLMALSICTAASASAAGTNHDLGSAHKKDARVFVTLVNKGVVFRDVVARETIALPWRDIVWALRRMEARGTARGGRFVTGFAGEQFALPEAVDQLRGVRRRERSSEVVRVSATDPLNVAGILLPGPRVTSVRTNSVFFEDGLTVASAETAFAAVASR